MNISYFEENRIFKIDTEKTSYVIGVADSEGFIGHVYYGARIADDDVSYLMRTDERPWTPAVNGRDRSSFLDTFPTEFSGNGVGDYRESAAAIRDVGGHAGTQFFYRDHKIFKGKRGLKGLPATFASEDEAMTLEIMAVDPVLGAEAVLSYTTFRGSDAIARSVKIRNNSDKDVYLER